MLYKRVLGRFNKRLAGGSKWERSKRKENDSFPISGSERVSEYRGNP